MKFTITLGKHRNILLVLYDYGIAALESSIIDLPNFESQDIISNLCDYLSIYQSIYLSIYPGEWKDQLGSTTSIDTVKQILSPDSTMNIESQLNGSNIDIDQVKQGSRKFHTFLRIK